MKQLMLAAAVSIVLSLPAMAQSNSTNTMQPHSQSRMGSPSRNRIEPSQLSTQQIRRIQTALDHKDFDVSRVDGKWGPRTEAAVKKFQQQQNLQGNGQLNRQTLGALGVSVNGQAQQGSATTGSGSSEKRMHRPAQNPGPMNNGRSGQGSNTSGGDNAGSSGSNQQ